ncbi:hypothetical protein TUBRATIS_10080, partial [Tubulinosema ratisbonensis]
VYLRIPDKYFLLVFMGMMVDLAASFYEKYEVHFLKMISVSAILFNLVLSLSYLCINFKFMETSGGLRMLFDIFRLIIYLCYSLLDHYFFNSGLKEFFGVIT